MKNMQVDIPSKIRELRVSKNLTQNELDKLANLPATSSAKIEQGRRQVIVEELLMISNALGVSVHVFFPDQDVFVSNEELHTLEALRLIPFDKFKRVMGMLEYEVFLKVRYLKGEKKKKMSELAVSLSRLTSKDQRPRSSLR